MKKDCSICGKNKEYSEFYKAYGKPRSPCISCVKEYGREYHKTHVNEKRIRSRLWREKNPIMAKANSTKNFYKHKEKRMKDNKNFLLKHPKQRKAVNAVNNAIRSGYLIRQKCIQCDKIGEGHHPDYNKQLEVTWLCSSHHKRLHYELNK